MDFYLDSEKSLRLSYGEIIDYVNNHDFFWPYYRAKNEVDFYLNFIKALLTNKEITLLDLDFSNAEIGMLVNDLKYLQYKENAVSNIHSVEHLINVITSSKTKITIYTSGTTGQPKKVTHSVTHFIKTVRISDDHQDDSWAFAYNPTHMAGLQVFFQAFLNQNRLVNVFNKPRKYILRQIEMENLSNISATPTFYKMLLPLDNILPKVKRLTLGGEKSDEILLNNIKRGFPNAKILNIYASTEAGALFVSKFDEFRLNESFAGKVKVVNNELFLHDSLLGKGEFNLTNTEWFPTGDIVDVISEEPLVFKFVSRKSELINIGGNNVNPSEVENKILAYPGVQNVKVFGKPNSVMGNLLVAEVIKSDVGLTEGILKEFLKEHLQNFKVPRIIKFVNHINLTRTGKISRI